MSKMAEIDMMMQDLKEHMIHHDWYYIYSDDHRYWTAGCESSALMTTKMNELKALGFTKEVDDLWNAHSPWGLDATRAALVSKLQTQVCEVIFTKVNGEERTMVCTLRPDLLPQVEQDENQSSQEAKSPKRSKESISVFLPEEKTWRSFRVESVKSLVATSL